MGFCTSWAEGKTMSICDATRHQFRLTNIYRLLYLSSILYFQLIAVPSGRKSISQPTQSPVRQTVKKPKNLKKCFLAFYHNDVAFVLSRL